MGQVLPICSSLVQPMKKQVNIQLLIFQRFCGFMHCHSGSHIRKQCSFVSTLISEM